MRSLRQYSEGQVLIFNMEKERKHALLSASSAKKWLNCTPSAVLENTLEEKTSPAAQEGTLAHEIGELKLRKLFTEQSMTDRTYKSRLNKLKKNELYLEEMDRHTDAYVDYVSNIAYGYESVPYISIEKQLDYGEWAKEGFGTADCIIIAGKTCHVIDFKYGKGVPVEAKANPQMGLYALGVLAAYGFIYPIEKVIMSIVQPRLNNFSSWETTANELRTWGDVIVKPKAVLAYKGEGEFIPGEYCDKCFCRAAGICRAQKDYFMELEEYKEKIPPLLSNEEVGDVLQKAQNIAMWVEKLKSYALNELLKGNEIPGWKIVEGRSNRTFTDVDAAFGALIDAGYEEAVLYDKKPITLTEIEKIISKEDYGQILAGYIQKPKGAPTLAPESDKRAEYKQNNNAADDFGGGNKYTEE